MDFLWTDGTTHTPGEPLREDVHAEVCVIGGGMTETIRESCDAHVHLRLTQAGRTILVCESDRAAYERRI